MEELWKAKLIDSKDTWIEGYYFRRIKRQLCAFGDNLKPEDEEHLIFVNGFSDWNMPRPIQCGIVDPETLCRNTGLHDSKQTEIWEHDLVKCEKRGAAFHRCPVRWNQEAARFDVCTIDCSFPMILDGEIKGEDYTVVGNEFMESDRPSVF